MKREHLEEARGKGHAEVERSALKFYYFLLIQTFPRPGNVYKLGEKAKPYYIPVPNRLSYKNCVFRDK